MFALQRLLAKLFSTSTPVKLLIAFACGSASVLALPPYYFFPILFVAFPVLVLLLDNQFSCYAKNVAANKIDSCEAGNHRSAKNLFFKFLFIIKEQFKARRKFIISSFWIGFCFGFGYFTFGVYWIGVAFITKGINPILMILALLLLISALAIFIGLTIGISSIFWSKSPLRILILSLVWLITELARGYIFPWNSIGLTALFSDDFSQGMSIFGMYGLGAIIILVVSSPAIVIASKCFEGFHNKGNGAVIAVAIVTILSLYGFGSARLSKANNIREKETLVRIVQPNIMQTKKWQKKELNNIYRTLLELTLAKVEARGIAESEREYSNQAISNKKYPDVVIWPEVALPIITNIDSSVQFELANLLRKDQLLIQGALWEENTGTKKSIYNAVVAINKSGFILPPYYKNILVPWGEYVPFASVLNALGIGFFTEDIGTFSHGKTSEVISYGDEYPIFSLAICYEIIFPEHFSESSLNSQDENLTSDAIITVTNDAWFGDTTGPYQHFAQARARAIELGIPVIRSANTGISGVIDAYGRVVTKLNINQLGYLDTLLPAKTSKTFYRNIF